MMRNAITSAIAGASLFGLVAAAHAATGEFDNMCAMGLTTGKAVATDCSVNATYKDKTYCFGNETAKQQFLKDPEANLAKAQEHYDEHKG